MAWIEAHSNLIDHPKTARMSELMGWNQFETAGRLLKFWFWCLEYAPTGDLRKYNDRQIGSAVVLNGEEAKRFVEAMVESCWIDRSNGVFRVHDWPDYAARYLRDSKFRNRPDLWRKVTEVYAQQLVASDTEAFKNNSRTVQEKSAVPTNLPTNLPTNQPGDDSDDLDNRIRRLIGGQASMFTTYTPVLHAKVRAIVDRYGWEASEKAIEDAVASGAARPVEYAAATLDNRRAKRARKAQDASDTLEKALEMIHDKR